MKNVLYLFLICFWFPAMAQRQFTVFFESNKFTLNSIQQNKLDFWIKQNASVKIIGASGFCDEDGSTTSNDSLAKKRINKIFDIVKSKIAIRSDFKAHSFGELHQVSKIKSENRKVTLFFIEPKDFVNENEILGIKPVETSIIKKAQIVFPHFIFLENPDGSKQEVALDTIFMKTVNNAKKGEILNIKNLNFVINTFIVVPQSRSKMYELLTVMQKNPQLKIQIQGHLCCNADDKRDLSGFRAKAIIGFLQSNNIEKSRMSAIGFGGTKPIYAIPEKSEYERAANRRVEILIIEN